MFYHCGKNDEDRIPSTCDFQTDNGSEMFDHINYGHSLYYCHKCSFKSRNKNDIEDHSHYEILLDYISNCKICGGPLEDGFQKCEKCSISKSDSIFVRGEDFLKCDLCDFKTTSESEFVKHQETESERLFKSLKDTYKFNNSEALLNKSKIEVIKKNVTVNNWFDYLLINDFLECFNRLSKEEQVLEIESAIEIEFSSRNTKIEIVNKLEHEIDKILQIKYNKNKFEKNLSDFRHNSTKFQSTDKYDINDSNDSSNTNKTNIEQGIDNCSKTYKDSDGNKSLKNSRSNDDKIVIKTETKDKKLDKKKEEKYTTVFKENASNEINKDDFDQRSEQTLHMLNEHNAAIYNDKTLENISNLSWSKGNILEPFEDINGLSCFKFEVNHDNKEIKTNKSGDYKLKEFTLDLSCENLNMSDSDETFEDLVNIDETFEDLVDTDSEQYFIKDGDKNMEHFDGNTISNESVENNFKPTTGKDNVYNIMSKNEVNLLCDTELTCDDKQIEFILCTENYKTFDINFDQHLSKDIDNIKLIENAKDNDKIEEQMEEFFIDTNNLDDDLKLDDQIEYAYFDLNDADAYYDNVIEPEIELLLKKHGIQNTDIKDSIEIEYDDSLFYGEEISSIQYPYLETEKSIQNLSIKQELENVMLNDESQYHSTSKFEIFPLCKQCHKLKRESLNFYRDNRKFKLSCNVCKPISKRKLELNTLIEFQQEKCDKCDVVFNYIHELRTHILSVHVFSCDQCDELFDSQNKLTTHILSQHVFTCGNCSMKFQMKDNLLQHLCQFKRDTNFEYIKHVRKIKLEGIDPYILRNIKRKKIRREEIRKKTNMKTQNKLEEICQI